MHGQHNPGQEENPQQLTPTVGSHPTAALQDQPPNNKAEKTHSRHTGTPGRCNHKCPHRLAPCRDTPILWQGALCLSPSHSSTPTLIQLRGPPGGSPLTTTQSGLFKLKKWNLNFNLVSVISFFCFCCLPVLATPTACRNFRVRDGTHLTSSKPCNSSSLATAVDNAGALTH